ncbi:MDR family MFS transporter [Streptomyces radicis]|uniref:MDR family MFS transporter n=1 Tax=Streptomyces radicis TaxID=1750517 RepID=UPI0016025453|nr:MDR family MFS transporter [Streptomyces radicis]
MTTSDELTARTAESGTPKLAGRKKAALAGLAIALLLAVLDQTIVATALPAIAREFHSTGSVSWVVTAYLITTVASAPLHGKLGDLYGRRPVFLAAVGLFVVASALAGAANSLGMLIAMRALQGLGGGGLMNLATAGFADLVPAAERGRVQGYTGGVFALGSIGGPLLGGLFAEHLSWRWIFYVNVPLGLGCLILTYVTFRVAHTPRSRPTARSVDFAGAALLATGVTAMLLVTVWGGARFAWGSWQILALTGATLTLGALFVLRESRAAEPLLPLRLFRDPVFRLGVPSSGLLGVALYGTIVYVPQFFEVTRGASPSQAGLALVPTMALAIIAGMGSAMRVSSTGRYRSFPVVGSLLITGGFLGLTRLTADTPLWLVFCFLALLGVGVGLHMQLMVFIVQNAVAHADMGTATAATMFFRALGGALGTALFSTLLIRGLDERLADTAPEIDPDDAYNAVTHHGGGLAESARPAVEEAFAASIHLVFLAALPFAALMLLLALFIPAVPLRRTVDDSAKDATRPA